MASLPRRRIDDPLWKSILEQTFGHFLEFFFPNAREVFDFKRPFEFLDKEFESLFPPQPNGKGVRYVDKLVKVYLLDGSEQYVLCHIEVQSAKGKGNLPERMFEYFYKISDKYHVPITAIAILADGNKSYHPKVYEQKFMGTSLRYTFNSYKILDQDEPTLRANPNPFAVVVLTTLLAIRHGQVTDEELMALKLDLYEEMMKRRMDRNTRMGLYDFLAYYVRFENQENFGKFVEEVKIKLGRRTVMGTREYLLEKAKNEGIEKGIEKGISKGKLEERAKAEAEKRAIALEFKKMGIPLADISKGTGLSIEEIEKLK